MFGYIFLYFSLYSLTLQQIEILLYSYYAMSATNQLSYVLVFQFEN